jgi:biotin carboxyl carrier protein
MLSNLVSQLKQQNALDKYDAVLLETPRVREDLGFPPLVTPTSQIVGTQAVFNVLSGERYKMVSKEVKEYVKGAYGRTPAPIRDDIRKKIIGDEQPITVRPADLLKPEWPKVVEEARKQGLPEDEESLLVFALYPAVAGPFLKGEATEEVLVCEGPAPAKAGGTAPASPATAPEKKEEKGAAAGSVSEEELAQVSAAPPAKAPSGPRHYRVRVGEKHFDVSVEEQSRDDLGAPAVWFPFGTSRSAKPPVQAAAAQAAAKVPSPTFGRSAVTPKKAPAPTASAAAPPAPAPAFPSRKGGETAKKGAVVAPMQGMILKLTCAIGDSVKAGQVLAVLEAMKMENDIQAPVSGVVREILVKKGEVVAAGTALIVLE